MRRPPPRSTVSCPQSRNHPRNLHFGRQRMKASGRPSTLPGGRWAQTPGDQRDWGRSLRTARACRGLWRRGPFPGGPDLLRRGGQNAQGPHGGRCGTFQECNAFWGVSLPSLATGILTSLPQASSFGYAGLCIPVNNPPLPRDGILGGSSSLPSPSFPRSPGLPSSDSPHGRLCLAQTLTLSSSLARVSRDHSGMQRCGVSASATLPGFTGSPRLSPPPRPGSVTSWNRLSALSLWVSWFLPYLIAPFALHVSCSPVNMQRVEGRQSRPHGEPHTNTHSDRVGTPLAFVLIPSSHSQDARAPRCREWRPVRQNRSDGMRLGEHGAPLEDNGPSLLPQSPPPSMQRFDIAKRQIEIHVSKLLFVLLHCNSLLDR